MSDIYIPGIRSRFNTEQIVDDLMRIERVPRDRAQSNVERFEAERIYWSDVGTRTNALRESASHLFSFQNPFSDRSVRSSDESIMTGTANRQAYEQDLSFTVKQLARSDRFLSAPLEENFQVESGFYSFTVGEEEISFDFRGGSLREFSEALNRRGRDLISSSLIAVRPGTRSLLIESRITGEENRLGFGGDSLSLGQATGMIELIYNEIPDVEADEDAEGLEINQNQAPTIRPLNPVSVAQDSIIAMEGIDIYRPTNEIDDLMTGVTISVKAVTDRPVRLTVDTDRETIKDSIINFVGHYNRLMAELNILTRNDVNVLNEITYFTREEREEYRERLGVFSADSSLLNLRDSLLRIATAQYPTSGSGDISLLSQIGIGTDVRRSGASAGSDASRLRGYLEIDERALDTALASNLNEIRELFAFSTTGDILPDTGVAYAIDSLVRPFSQSGGLISIRTGNIDSRITQETRRIETLDRQLAAREIELRRQYSIMEGAFQRMEQMSSSLDRFQQQNNFNNR
ncbi:MAG: flagellar filament capping protein FliD [Treponema sp.]|nr:flagellar filament capping protein FliD [Treponema sp.]